MAFSFRILLSPFSFRHSYVCSLSFEAIKLCYSNTIFVLSIKQFNDWNQFFVRTVWHIQYTNIESKAAINDSKVNWWLVTTSFDISDNSRISLVNWTLCLCSIFIHRSRMWSDFCHERYQLFCRSQILLCFAMLGVWFCYLAIFINTTQTVCAKSRWPLLIFHFGCTSRYICWSYADWNHQIRDRPDVDGCANARAYLSSGEKGMKIFYVYDKHNNSSINYRRIVNYLCCNSTAPRWAPNRAHYFSPYLFIQFLFLSLFSCSVLIEK